MFCLLSFSFILLLPIEGVFLLLLLLQLSDNYLIWFYLWFALALLTWILFFYLSIFSVLSTPLRIFRELFVGYWVSACVLTLFYSLGSEKNLTRFWDIKALLLFLLSSTDWSLECYNNLSIGLAILYYSV